MRKLSFFLCAFVFTISIHANGDSLVCEILGDTTKRVQCTYFSERVAHDRNITFAWRSPSLQADQRKRTITLNAHHGSLYDYRYYYGRAPGEWEVSVSENGTILASTRFEIKESEEDKEY